MTSGECLDIKLKMIAREIQHLTAQLRELGSPWGKPYLDDFDDVIDVALIRLRNHLEAELLICAKRQVSVPDAIDRDKF